MTDNIPLCGYCGNPQHNHELQDHKFVPVGGGAPPYFLPRDRQYHPVLPPAEPMSRRSKLLLFIGLPLLFWCATIWWCWGQK
jgi:hypothetical protein